MILTCPQCKVQYTVPALAISPEGRKVKCSRCAHVWRQMPQAGEAAAPDPWDRPAAHAVDANAAVHHPLPVPRKAPSLLRRLAVASSLAVCAAALGVLAHADAFPGLAAKLGMVDTEGLVFSGFTAQKERVGNRLRFALSGTIVNESSGTKSLPEVIITVFSKGGREMGKITFTPPKPMLEAGEKLFIQPEVSNISGNADVLRLDIGNKWEVFFR